MSVIIGPKSMLIQDNTTTIWNTIKIQIIVVMVTMFELGL